MTSAQLILVSVSSALIAVIAMLVVATVLRARTRESTGSDASQPAGPKTRAQRAATRAQRRAQRATLRAEKKAAKAAESVSKLEKKKAALAAAKTEPPDGKSPAKEQAEAGRPATDAPTDKVGDSADKDTNSSADELIVPDAEGRLDEPTESGPSYSKEDEVPTTEAGKKAAEAKPKARRSLLGREKPTDDSSGKKG